MCESLLDRFMTIECDTSESGFLYYYHPLTGLNINKLGLHSNTHVPYLRKNKDKYIYKMKHST